MEIAMATIVRKLAAGRGLLVVLFCVASGGCWGPRSTTSPPAVSGHAMAYDPVQQQVMFFGGADDNNLLSDTWHWDNSDSVVAWSKNSPANHPSARFRPALACDSYRNRVVLFGGFAGTDVSQETWEWDGTNWIQMNPSPSPDPRHYHAMAYDSQRHVVVMFGGYTTFNGRRDLDDTWEWDGTSWKEKTPLTTRPPARDAHAMAYDANRGKIVLFGGAQDIASITYLNDTWEWDGADWKLMSDGKQSSDPPPRGKMTMAYSDKYQKVLMFGGLTSPPTKFFDDTYTWDGASWARLNAPPFTKTPDARSDHAMAYDPKSELMIMSGGIAGNPPARQHNTWAHWP